MEHTDYINRVKKASELRQEFVKKADVLVDRILLFIFVLFVSDLFFAVIALISGWNQTAKYAMFVLAFLFLWNQGNTLWREQRKTKSLKAFAESFPEEAEILKQNKKEQEAVNE
ncbi:MAG: hypothetical protein NTZ13_03430 [Candidatus Parcubacteria bacterium]|nr:hypothetical protein [Candidatus Parcubacteria bacterium]